MAERVISFDPGAERQGWGVLEREHDGTKVPPVHLGSGVFGVPRTINGSKTDFQPYRLSVIELWNEQMPALIRRYEPDEMVSEIVPPVGASRSGGIQLQLALCAITTCQSIALQHDLPVSQIGATTVKTRIGGNKKASKVKVRNGVITIMPELADRKKEWTTIFEVPDALAVGLTHWGYKV